jgi:hypothetical protein
LARPCLAMAARAEPASKLASQSASGAAAAAPRARKASPMGEWAFYYFGTLALLAALDHWRVLHAGWSAWEALPAELGRLRALLGALDGSNAVARESSLFALGGFVLVAPMTALRALVHRLFLPLATRGSGLVSGSAKCDKYLEQCWLAVYYSVAVCAEVYTLRAVTAHWPPVMTAATRQAVVMSQAAVVAHHAQPEVRAVYLLAYTFYFMELVTLVTSAKARARSDAFVYAIHHVLTVLLISLSYIFMHTHAGLLVLVFHDVGDIFLPVAKCFAYSEEHARAHYSRATFKKVELAGVLFFVLFLLAFAGPRLVLFPVLIYYLAFFGGWSTKDGAFDLTHPRTWARKDEPVASAGAYLTGMLLLLLPLHVYWFRCALRVAYRAVMGVYEDERSDDEEDDPAGEAAAAARCKKAH